MNKKISRCLPVLVGSISLLFFIGEALVNSGVRHGGQIILSIALIIGGIYRNRTPIIEELFVDELIKLKKKSICDEEIHRYLKSKYGEDVYNRVIENK